MHWTHHRYASAATLMCLTISAPSRLQAQATEARGHRQAIIVALVDTLPRLREGFAAPGQPARAEAGYSAVVQRTPGPQGRDIILLPRGGATAALLERATQVVLHSRLRQGDHPSAIRGRPFDRLLLGVWNRSATNTPPAPADLAAAQIIIDRLPTAPLRELAKIGRVPAIAFVPPPIMIASSTPRPGP